MKFSERRALVAAMRSDSPVVNAEFATEVVQGLSGFVLVDKLVDFGPAQPTLHGPATGV